MKNTVIVLKNTAVAKVVRRYFENGVGKSGAAHAYHLLFAIFPLMIFVSNLLGRLNLDVYAVTNWLSEFLPNDMVSLLESYFEYISENYSASVLGFSFVFTLYFPFRATRSMMNDIRRAYGLGEPLHPVAYTVRQIVFTLVLFLSIAVSLLLSTLGKQVILFIVKTVKIRISVYHITLWHYLRFLFIGVFLFVTVFLLYALAQDRRVRLGKILPGAMSTILAWILVSAGFSFYVENFAKYSVIYGALGTVIVLMLWLYLISVILIMGAELNSVLDKNKQTRSEKNEK